MLYVFFFLFLLLLIHADDIAVWFVGASSRATSVLANTQRAVSTASSRLIKAIRAIRAIRAIKAKVTKSRNILATLP